MLQSRSRRRPERLLFLSDCYLSDTLWGPFHQSLLHYLAAAFPQVLAVRANAFFHDWSLHPISDEAANRLAERIRRFNPDLVFSTNRAGLGNVVCEALGPDVPILTLFVDSFERIPEPFHRYGARDLIWIGGLRSFESFSRRFAGALATPPIATQWAADPRRFFPLNTPRTTAIVFIGTPFSVAPFVSLLEGLKADDQNRKVFLQVYEAHRREYIDDWPAALQAGGFDFTRLPAEHSERFRDHTHLQACICDQITAENRIRFLSAIEPLGVRLFGVPTADWVQNIALVNSGLLKSFAYRAVSDPAEVQALYCAARLGINLQHEHARGQGLSFRAFDIMACQTLLVTHADARAALSEMDFREDVDYVGFSAPEELLEKCRYYLDHPSVGERLAESAYRKVRENHTLSHRLAAVFDHFGFAEVAAEYQAQGRREAALARPDSCPGIPPGVQSFPASTAELQPRPTPGPDLARRLADELAAVRASWSFKVGSMALGPVKAVRRFFRAVSG